MLKKIVYSERPVDPPLGFTRGIDEHREQLNYMSAMLSGAAYRRNLGNDDGVKFVCADLTNAPAQDLVIIEVYAQAGKVKNTLFQLHLNCKNDYFEVVGVPEYENRQLLWSQWVEAYDVLEVFIEEYQFPGTAQKKPSALAS